jgi:membrane protein DedA with SNARE-associated domain
VANLELITHVLKLFTQANQVIEKVVSSGGSLAYIIMFLILFIGAAFVFTAPVLPSISLIFLVASLCVAGLLNPFLSFIVLIAAISLGDLTSFFIGKAIRHKLINNQRIPFIKVEHINQTRKIYDKADFLSIVLARFTPMIGSFAQLVAGTIDHKISTFCKRNVISGVIWLIVNFTGGLLIAFIPMMKSNFVLIFMIVPFASMFLSIGYYLARNYASIVLMKRA